MNLAACGEAKFKSAANSSVAPATSTSVAPLATGDSTKKSNDNSSVKLPALKFSDADALNKFISQILAELGLGLQGVEGGKFSFDNNGITYTQTFKCLAGTVRFTSTASTSANVTLKNVSMSSSGSGSVVFTNCSIKKSSTETIEVNGTIALTQFTGSMTASIDLLNGVNTIKANNSSLVTGALVVKNGDAVENCSVALTDMGSVNGTIDVWNFFSSTGSISMKTSGNICDFSIDKTINLSY